MTENVTGLILRTRPLTETSLIVHWLTAELGWIATVAKGARRPKSPFCGQLDLFYLAELSFDRSRRSQLHNLREVRLQRAHRGLREDLRYVQQASYCAQLIEQATEMESPLPATFDLMLGLLNHIVGRKPQARTIFAFELRFLDQLGLRPDLDQTRLKPDTRKLVDQLLGSDWDGLLTLEASASQVAELGRFLVGFLTFHLGRIPPNRAEALLQSRRGSSANTPRGET
jgi:DNA repair protein RecO (recombination protein O)